MFGNSAVKTAILFLTFLISCFGQPFVRLRPAIAPDGRQAAGSPKLADRLGFALLVGISRYKNEKLNKIDGCENNVPLLAETLITDYGFDEKNVDASLLDERATKAEILKRFQTHLIENARKASERGEKAVIVYYFCGHGSQYADQDNDENDGLDETFVAYDSRTADVFDILDDEIDDLKARLRQFTNNTTLIFESCHSGTGSRGDLSEKRLISEETAPDKRARPSYKRRFLPTSDEDLETYTEIAASLSTNTAKSESKDYCNCEKPYSLMTKALVEGLKRATDSTTYRSLLKDVSTVVAERSRQEPQLEGNRDVVLFGAAAKKAKPYIEIDKILSGNRIIIKAGKTHGLREGSQIAVYTSFSLTRLGTDDGWLTNGIVNEVRDFQSIVQLPPAKENPQVKEIGVTSRVVLSSPVFGGGSVLLMLNPTRAKMLADTETGLHEEIKKRLMSEGLLENRIVRLIDSDKPEAAGKMSAKGIVRLRKGKIGEIFQGKTTEKIPDASLLSLPLPKTSCAGNVLETDDSESRLPSPETEVYYLDDGESGGKPLFGKFFDPRQQKVELAGEISRVVRNFAYRMNLRSLDNAASTLPRKIKVSVELLKGGVKCENGVIKPNFRAERIIKTNKIEVDSYFKFNIKNISGEVNRKESRDQAAGGEPLHIVLLALSNNGDIRLVYSSQGANDPLGDGRELDRLNRIILNARLPVGTEQYIVIVSKTYVDFSFYESQGNRRKAKSILERLLTQSGQRSRETATFMPDEPHQWGVISMEFSIIEKIR